MKLSVIYHNPGKFFISFILILTIVQAGCKKEENNRFPLADQYDIDGGQLTLAYDEFKTVEGALSLIVCREGTIVAEEYTDFNSYGADNLPLVATPGAVFNYSDGASHLLSAIITEATGMSTLDFAAEKLFNPLGITEYEWSTDDRGYHLGAASLRIKPRDMVRFGNMILNKGKYDGVQIVPENWINEMTSAKISTNNDIPYGPEYGYQMWLGNASGRSYSMAMGWGGQFIIIVPKLKLVVTATCWTSDLTDQQAGEHWMSINKIIFEKILPRVS